jgi:MFS transporter, ACS family, glucarate transporter
MKNWGWRASFYCCGCVGLVVAAVWRACVTDDPAAHPHVNSAELAKIRGAQLVPESATGSQRHAPVSLLRLFSNASVAGLVLSYFFVGYASYLYYTWFYLYLVQVRHLSLMQGGIWGSTPFVAMALMTPLGGWVSDTAVVRFGRRRGRQIGAWVGLGLASPLLWLGGHLASNTPAILVLAVGAGFLGFATTGWWAACIDLAPNYSGSLSGLMNMGGNLGGWISPVLTAYIATHFGWTQALDFAAVLTLIAAALWSVVRADQNLEWNSGRCGI